MIRVTDARHVRDFVVWIQFNDGTNGEVDLSDELYGPVFKPLQDLEYFASFEVDAEAHTLTWPNGADFAPEFLHHKVAVAA
jgi:hypothetical protein